MSENHDSIIAGAIDGRFPIADITQQRNVAGEDLGADGALVRMLTQVVDDIERDVEALAEPSREFHHHTFEEERRDEE